MKSIVFSNVSFRYNAEHVIFDNICFSLTNPESDKGYIIALMGASGTGKSTLLKLILGLLKPDSGQISLTPDQPVISYVPQEGVLFDHLSPLENARYFSRISSYRKSFDDSLFNQLSEALGMTSILKNSRNINDLSGGQRQRLTLLRALSIKPDILLLDEPTTGLDSEVKLQFLHKVREIVMDQKLLAIYVSHHKVETELIVDEIAYMVRDQTGRNNVYQADLKTFLRQPPIIDAVRVLSYPMPNLVHCVIGDMQDILLCDKSNAQGFYLILSPANLQFSTTKGFISQLVSRNHKYTVVRLDNGDLLTFFSEIHSYKQGDRLVLTGGLLRYGMTGLFLDSLQIMENRVVEINENLQ